MCAVILENLCRGIFCKICATDVNSLGDSREQVEGGIHCGHGHHATMTATLATFSLFTALIEYGVEDCSAVLLICSHVFRFLFRSQGPMMNNHSLA